MAYRINSHICDVARPCSVYIGPHVASNKPTPRQSQSKFRAFIRKIFNYFGGQEIRYKYAYREEDISQVKVFNPDIIFSCLGSLNSMKDCLRVIESFPSAKLVLYIVDDWVNTKENNRFLPSFWRRQNNKLFRLLIDKASVLLSICPYMSEVYKELYGKTFIPFHNPVDLDKWISQSVIRRYDKHIKSVLYVGKINADTRDCLLDTASIVEEINKSIEGIYRYRLDVYSPNYIDNQDLFCHHPNCKVFPPIPHSEIIKLTKGYDALLLTLGFSNNTRLYVRLSMPTKLTEYLAAGIPSILYSPEEIALAKYLVPNNCSINCLHRNHDELKHSLLSLSNQSYCSQIVQNALALASQHDASLVRRRFEDSLLNLAEWTA